MHRNLKCCFLKIFYFCNCVKSTHKSYKHNFMSNKGKYVYSYWRPAAAVDNVVFCFKKGRLYLLLVKRGQEPFKDQWAFPGGFLEEGETLEAAAKRELMEETHITPLYTDQIGTFSAIDRDPRSRVISTAFLHVVSKNCSEVLAGDDAQEAKWFPIDNLPDLAFDHAAIYQKALRHIKISFHYTTIAFTLLGETFTLPDMYRLHSAVFQIPLDRRNFQKKFLKLNLIRPVEDLNARRSPRAPRFYRFNEEGYKILEARILKP